MRPLDLLTLPLAALWRQKLRTILTTLGVIFGAYVLAASLSIDQGVQETMARVARENDLARKIDVSSTYPPVPAGAEELAKVQVPEGIGGARREAFRRALAVMQREDAPNRVPETLTRDRLRQITALPHVVEVMPDVNDGGSAMLELRPEPIGFRSARADDEVRRRRVVAGRYFDGPDDPGVVVSEFLAYRLGLASDAAIDGLVGQSIALELEPDRANRGLYVWLQKASGRPNRAERRALDRLAGSLPAALDKVDLDGESVATLRKALGEDARSRAAISRTYSEEFPIIGISRLPTEAELGAPDYYAHADADVLLTTRSAVAFEFRANPSPAYGLNRATVLVDEDANVKAVLERIKAFGLDGHAAIEFIERERLMYLLIFGAMTCVAAVALLVSALGIANTMLMSVLERRREIGIMKAVGADNRHLQLVFLFEGALIGLVGAVVGLALAWASSFPGDSWVRSMVLRDMKIDLKGSIFVFPPWIGATVLGFTILVTTLAAYYPARHASRIDPVGALRHE